MLLIIFLALMANSALASDACDVGPPKLDNFDWNKFADNRDWFFLLHDTHEFQNNLECPTSTLASPEGNVSKVNSLAYDKVAQSPFVKVGTATNWDSTGYFEANHEVPFWTGTYLVLAVDYDRYFIAKHCPLNSNEVTVYVAFRSSRPDIVTWLRVLKKLLENKIDITELVIWPTNHCQQAGSSTEGGRYT